MTGPGAGEQDPFTQGLGQPSGAGLPAEMLSDAVADPAAIEFNEDEFSRWAQEHYGKDALCLDGSHEQLRDEYVAELAEIAANAQQLLNDDRFVSWAESTGLAPEKLRRGKPGAIIGLHALFSEVVKNEKATSSTEDPTPPAGGIPSIVIPGKRKPEVAATTTTTKASEEANVLPTNDNDIPPIRLPKASDHYTPPEASPIATPEAPAAAPAEQQADTSELQPISEEKFMLIVQNASLIRREVPRLEDEEPDRTTPEWDRYETAQAVILHRFQVQINQTALAIDDDGRPTKRTEAIKTVIEKNGLTDLLAELVPGLAVLDLRLRRENERASDHLTNSAIGALIDNCAPLPPPPPVEASISTPIPTPTSDVPITTAPAQPDAEPPFEEVVIGGGSALVEDEEKPVVDNAPPAPEGGTLSDSLSAFFDTPDKDHVDPADVYTEPVPEPGNTHRLSGKAIIKDDLSPPEPGPATVILDNAQQTDAVKEFLNQQLAAEEAKAPQDTPDVQTTPEDTRERDQEGEITRVEGKGFTIVSDENKAETDHPQTSEQDSDTEADTEVKHQDQDDRAHKKPAATKNTGFSIAEAMMDE